MPKKKTWKELDIVKLNTIKRYIKEVQGLNVSVTALHQIHSRYNELIRNTVRAASNSAKKDKLKTIMPRHMQPAIESIVGRKNLTISELEKQIRRLSAIDLGALVKTLTSYIQELKDKKR